MNYDPGSSLTLEGETYELKQFHFHANSEHQLAGQAAPIEMHLVHKSADGDTAVVGVWLTQGADNPAFAPIFSHLPTTQGDPAPVPGATVDAAQLLPIDRAYYRYNGSLTTPPCTQGVKWVVIDDPVALSAEQISAFTAIYSGNFRPVQPLNSRTFLSVATSAPAPGTPATLPVTGAEPSVPMAGYALAIAGVLLLMLGLVLHRQVSR